MQNLKTGSNVFVLKTAAKIYFADMDGLRGDGENGFT